MTKIVDDNGFWIFEETKITKEGVFPYFNKNIGVPEKSDDEIVWVYRPKEELDNQILLDDFHSRPIPLTDEHEMIGEDMTPPEDKGVDGNLTEVYFSPNDNSLKGKITVYSQKMQREISSGKRELSLGYFCNYEIVPGMFNGKHYDAIQRNLRPNHIALVDKGRSGSDVRVQDKAICYDSIEMELTMETKDIEHIKGLYKDLKAETFDEFKSSLMACDYEEFKEVFKEEETEDEEEKKTEDEFEEKEEKKEEEKKEEKTEDKCGTTDSADVILSLKKEIADLKATTDSLPKTLRADMSAARELADKLSNYIGTFDSSEMTCAEVASYGCKKLGLKVADTEAKAALEGYFAAAKKNDSFAMDSAFTRKSVDAVKAYKMRGNK